MSTDPKQITTTDAELVASTRWNMSADEFNQWCDLSADERAELIAAVKHGQTPTTPSGAKGHNLAPKTLTKKTC